MRKGIAFVLGVIVLIPAATQAQSVKFSVSFPKVYDEWMRDEPKHVNHLTVNAFQGSVEYKARVVNADTGQVVASGSTVPQGTKLKFEFLPETMSWHTSGSVYDTPYAYWTQNMPPAPVCATADRIINETGKTFRGKVSGKNIFSPVYAVPPAKSAQNASALGTCTTPADGDITCTASVVGTHTVTFNFNASKAYHYLRIYNMDVSRDSSPASRWPRVNKCEPLGILSGIRDFSGGATNEPRSTVTLPAKSIPFTVKVAEGVPPTEGPQTPMVSAAGGRCTIDVPHTISMTASHTENKNIRYLIDWNNDGSADQTIPASGYVAAGSSQSVSRTYTVVGRKDIAVRAQDEDGALSPWAAFSFTCDHSSSSDTAGLSGEDTAGLGNDGVPPAPSVNDLSLRALPSLVRLGGTTKVHWSSQNMSSCTVTGSNDDSWSGLNSPAGGEGSGAINGLVTYTLTCRVGGETFTKTATVNVLPSWVEK